MILEGIVTTQSPVGLLNIAPMGPKIPSDMNMGTFVLRPYQTSTTYQNLKGHGEGVFHVTDDVLLLAQAAGAVGLGRGFAVHKALDQLGAIAGPLLVAAVAALTGVLWPALAVLLVPGIAAIAVLVWLRRRMGDARPRPKAPATTSQPATAIAVRAGAAAKPATERGPSQHRKGARPMTSSQAQASAADAVGRHEPVLLERCLDLLAPAI